MQSTPLVTFFFVAPLIGAAALLLVLVRSSWRGRRVPERVYFSLLLTGIGLWCGFYALEASVPPIAAKTVFAQLQYLGIASVPVLLLLFALYYSGNSGWLRPKVQALLFVIPTLTLLLIATNGLHHLVWSSVRADPSGPFPALLIEHGPYFWVHLIYSYLLVLAATGVLITSAVRFPQDCRRQSVLVIVAAIAPLVANIFYALGLIPDDNLDLTPYAFAVTGGLLALALSRYRLFDLFLGLRAQARSALVESMPDAVLVIDGEGRIVDSNPAARQVLEHVAQPLTGISLAEAIGLEYSSPEFARSEGSRHEIELPVEGGGGIFDVLVSRLGSSQAGPSGHLIVLRDITERRRAVRASLESERRYRLLIENARDLIFTMDAEARLTQINPAVERVTGFLRAELLGRRVQEIVARRGEELSAGLVDEEFQTREIRLLTKAGTSVVLEGSVRSICKDGAVTGYECIARDVTEARAWEEALRFQALHDSVTNLPNRVQLRERLQELIAGGGGDNRRFALLLLDLDDFKHVNDNLGHHLGDSLLELVSSRLTRSIRSADIVARLGGDEFALVVRLDEDSDVGRIAMRVLDIFKRRFSIEGNQISVSASVGVALFPEHGTTVDGLLQFADIAMYAAKRGGGSRYAMYEVKGKPPLDRATHPTVGVARSVREATVDPLLSTAIRPASEPDHRSRGSCSLEPPSTWTHTSQSVSRYSRARRPG